MQQWQGRIQALPKGHAKRSYGGHSNVRNVQRRHARVVLHFVVLAHYGGQESVRQGRLVQVPIGLRQGRRAVHV